LDAASPGWKGCRCWNQFERTAIGGVSVELCVRLHGLGAQGPKLLLFALVITWVGDTVAYFVGRAIGKHPLART